MTLKLDEELLAEVERLREIIFNICVSMVSAGTQKPEGFPSGLAITLPRTDALILKATDEIAVRKANEVAWGEMRRGTTDDEND